MSGAQDRVNRATFSRQEVVADHHYARGWSDLGERRLFRHLASVAAGGRVLDLGVGSGRTTQAFLERVSTDYVGVDYSPAMVREARRRFPDVDLRDGDARDLSELTDASFDVVHFSYNGLDLVGHEDREQVLREMVRVCRPGGRVSYSTFNLDSFYARARPWNLDAEGHRLEWHPDRALAWARSASGQVPRYARTWRNWLRICRAGEEGDGWAVRPLQVHEFGALAHFTSRRALREELARHGLVPERVLATTGDLVDLAEDHGEEPYRHVCAIRT